MSCFKRLYRLVQRHVVEIALDQPCENHNKKRGIFVAFKKKLKNEENS